MYISISYNTISAVKLLLKELKTKVETLKNSYKLLMDQNRKIQQKVF